MRPALLKNTMFWVFRTSYFNPIFVIQKATNMKVTILDYSFNYTWTTGCAKVQVFNHEIEFEFSFEAAVTAAIELGIIEQPDDRDKDRVGYEFPAWSATVRQSFDYAKRIQYTANNSILGELSGTYFAEQIVSRLALQSDDVREAIQAEITAIACCDLPANILSAEDLATYFANSEEYTGVFDCVNWDHVSQHKIASLRTENKLIEKLL